jgi:hypothetical protein
MFLSFLVREDMYTYMCIYTFFEMYIHKRNLHAHFHLPGKMLSLGYLMGLPWCTNTLVLSNKANNFIERKMYLLSQDFFDSLTSLVAVEYALF